MNNARFIVPDGTLNASVDFNQSRRRLHHWDEGEIIVERRKRKK